AKPTESGWIINGKKIFASLSGHADYYGVLCTEIAEGEKASRRNTLYLALPAKADGVSVVGDWDPLGMRGTVSRTLLFKDVFVEEDAALMPRGVYFQAAQRWPHMFLTLSPTYMGIARLRCAIFGDGRRQRDRNPRDPHLRGPGDAEVAAAGAHLSRQPLRLADAALDRRALPRPHRPRGAVRGRRNGRLTVDLSDL